MAALAELLEAVASGITGAGDYRADKTALFGAAAEALPGFLPLAADGSASNPIQVLDFFSGAGGASLGFAAINSVVPAFHFLAGCDIDPASAATYGKNFGTPVACEDILKIADTPASVRAFLGKVGFDRRKSTILIGCAPCQGFSSHRKKHWGDADDDRNGLAIAFSRIVAEVGPSAFIMENVPEFLSSRHWSYFGRARKIFGEAGYTVRQNIYNAAQFGVPQERFRCIVIGMKKKFLLPEGRFAPDKYRTVREAIGGLPPLRAGERDPTDLLHRAVAHKKSTIDVIKKVPLDGGSLPEGEGPECLGRVKGFYDVYGRLSWDMPAITITHYARNPASGRFTHPAQDRGLTAREAARLQGFPDGFRFEGKADDIYRQIGEAVPPLLSCGVAADVMIEHLSKEPTPAQMAGEADAIELPVINSYSSVIAGIKSTRRRAQHAFHLR